MKKIKVLRIVGRLNIGGPAIHTILLAAGLDKNKFDSRLVSGLIDRFEGDMSYYAAEKKIAPYFVPELKREINFFADFAALVKVYRIISAWQPDIIHTHTAKAGSLGRLAALLYNLLHPLRGSRIKLVHTFHGHIFEGYFNKFKTKLFIIIERLLGLFTCQIITVSESIKKELIALKIAKGGKIKVIALGLELDRFLGVPVRDGPGINIGIVGRLVPIKNHRLFLDAADNVLKYNPQKKTRFKIIGGGQLRPELEAYCARLKLGAYVDFLGWQKDLAKVYADLDIVALTSINEGTPLSLIEAMASSKAVVATDAGGVKDLLGRETHPAIVPEADFKILERGIMTSTDDPLGFARALILLSQQDELRLSLGRAARVFVEARFSKERLIKDIEDLYAQVY